MVYATCSKTKTYLEIGGRKGIAVGRVEVKRRIEK
jgi:hypothetical protein